MKTLMIAIASSPFGKETYERLLLKNIDVNLLDFATLKLFRSDCSVDEKYSQAYNKYKKIPLINQLIKMYFISKILIHNDFKILNLHVAYVYYILILPILIRYKLIVTIYGSDFYRMNNFQKWLQKFIYQNTHIVTFTNPLTLKSFHEYYNDLLVKTNVCRFGLGTLDFIDKNRNKDILEIKQILGYSQTKIIVTCGYNATKEQQHEKIIKNLILLDTSILNNIQFIFPMTYGDKIYRETIKKKLKMTNLDYIVLEDFLYEDKNAFIKLASDVMINMLQTDSFSGSMQEFLYANNLVITGSWLPYEVFDNEGVFYYKIDDIYELKDKLMVILSNLNKENTIKNQQIIYSLSSWEANIKEWIEVYHLE